jgi:hypothetical protein
MGGELSWLFKEVNAYFDLQGFAALLPMGTAINSLFGRICPLRDLLYFRTAALVQCNFTPKNEFLEVPLRVFAALCALQIVMAIRKISTMS